ncbi:alpha/beta fold hydrolase, partial [Rothia kristinae]
MLRARPRHSQGRREWVTTRDGRELCAMVIDGPRCGAAEAAGAVCPRPTVIVESDAADTRSPWALVQRAVGVSARTVVYDRTGLGRSAGPDPRPGTPWTLECLAADLEDLLEHFGAGPFVLVGHGTGGPVVRAVAARRRERISGLVLVDPVDELGPAPTPRRFGPAGLGSPAGLMSPEHPAGPRRELPQRRRPRWAAALSGAADAAPPQPAPPPPPPPLRRPARPAAGAVPGALPRPRARPPAVAAFLPRALHPRLHRASRD